MSIKPAAEVDKGKRVFTFDIILQINMEVLMDRQFKDRILRSLLCETISPDEIMRAYNIFHHEVPLHRSVAAFAYRSKKNRFHIFINTYLSPEARREVFLHELYHVIEDMPQVGYVLGLDGYREPMEERADQFAEKFAVYAVK